MLRALFLSKAALVLVGILPVLFGEIALLHGNCAAGCGETPVGSSRAATHFVPATGDAHCIVYEAASGRLVTVKAPEGGRAADCARL